MRLTSTRFYKRTPYRSGSNTRPSPVRSPVRTDAPVRQSGQQAGTRTLTVGASEEHPLGRNDFAERNLTTGELRPMFQIRLTPKQRAEQCRRVTTLRSWVVPQSPPMRDWIISITALKTADRGQGMTKVPEALAPSSVILEWAARYWSRSAASCASSRSLPIEH